jgi:hypothetical protein
MESICNYSMCVHSSHDIKRQEPTFIKLKEKFSVVTAKFLSGPITTLFTATIIAFGAKCY